MGMHPDQILDKFILQHLLHSGHTKTLNSYLKVIQPVAERLHSTVGEEVETTRESLLDEKFLRLRTDSWLGVTHGQIGSVVDRIQQEAPEVLRRDHALEYLLLLRQFIEIIIQNDMSKEFASEELREEYLLTLGTVLSSSPICQRYHEKNQRTASYVPDSENEYDETPFSSCSTRNTPYRYNSTDFLPSSATQDP